MSNNKSPVPNQEIALIPEPVSTEDAEFLESRKFVADEICRSFGIRPYMLGHQSISPKGTTS